MKKPDRAPMKRAQQVGDLIRELRDQPGFGEQISRHQAWLVWDQIVGEQIAARARPRKLRGRVLEVLVDHPVWMQQLHMLKPKILEKINREAPNAGITDIYLRQAKPADAQIEFRRNSKKQEPLPWDGIELEAWEKKNIDNMLEDIDNDELRDEFRRLLTLQKRVDKKRRS